MKNELMVVGELICSLLALSFIKMNEAAIKS
eukprot:UN09082